MILVENKGRQIFVFSRDSKGNATYEQIKDFYPYFYSQHPDGEYNTIDGKKAKKIIVNSPGDVKIERDKYAVTYESDILYTNRFIINRLKTIEKVPIRICYLDIEVARTSNGYESPRKANNPILMIGCYDSFDKKKKRFCLTKTHETEKEMLNDFIKYIQQTNPDIIIAWNGDNFDFPFIINRINKLGLNSNMLARQETGFVGKTHYIANNYKIPRVQGRILFDLMYAYKKMHSMEGRESWALDYISKYEGLGGKEKYKGELDDLFRKDIDKFISYNDRDVELLVLLNEKLGIVDFFDEIRRLCYCQFIDIFMNSKMADCLCLRYAREHKFVLPRVKEQKREPYTGGFVHSSEPKLHKNIAVMDMKSLYPSIMIGFNTSYETLLEKKEDNCINLDNKFFYKKEPGMIPSIVKPMLKKRKEVVKEMEKYDDKNSIEYKSLWQSQYALKVIANSFYGVMGFRLFRLYKRDVAQSITHAARKIIKEVLKWFEEKGLRVVYGDTDSVFIEMKDKTKEDIQKLNKDINIYFRKYFLQFGISEDNNIFKLEFEKIFKTVFFKKKADGTGAKKRYAGIVILEDGEKVDKFYIRGFESRRSDNPQVGRDFIKEVLKMICDEKSKEEIDKYVDEFKNKVRTEFIPEQIALPIGISKSLKSYGNQIHVRAARLANEKHNAQIQGGDKIKYLYVKGENNVIGWKSEKWMWDGYEVDYDMMIRRIVDLKIGPLYEGLGWEYPYLQIMGRKKKKEIKFEDTLTQEELW